MKKALLLFTALLCTASLFAQKKLKNADFLWDNSPKYGKVTEIPDKWKNESAVIIYQSFSYEYEGKARSIDYIETTRQRIKLLDKSAVDDYSEFSFAEKIEARNGFYRKGGKMLTGIKVIKPNGNENIIDLENAVEIKSEKDGGLKKIAVPDLEVGDIIDYYYYIYEPFVSYLEYSFDPIISRLSDTYPVMKQNLEFKVGKNFFINFNSLNGAPELKVKDDSAKKMVIYSLEDENREKSKSIRWYYPRREEPIVKFQVVYARKAKLEKSADAFLGEKEQVKKSVSKEEVLNYYKKRFSFDFGDKALYKHLKANGFNDGPKDKLIREAYFFLRDEDLNSKIEPIFFYQENYITFLDASYGRFPTDRGFINGMGSFLKKQNIDFDIILAIPRTISDIKSLLITNEITPIIKVNLKEPIYLSKYSVHTNVGYIPYELEGTTAYLVDIDSKYKMSSIKKFDIPISHYEKNQSLTKSEVKFKVDDITVLDVDRHVSSKGYNKSNDQYDLIYLFDYVYEDNAYYKKPPYIDRIKLKSKERTKVASKLKAKQKELADKQKEAFEKNAKNELDLPIKSYDSYELLNMGRFEDPVFEYKESLVLEDLIKRAGKNYIFEAGKLIGGQVALKEDELKRETDIYMPYARSFINEISIQIPDGYTVEGIDKLNKQVENSAGGFVSTAKVVGGQLKITTKKYYANNFEKAEKWSELVAFLEAAFQFTQEKVLLKKSS